MNCSFYCCHGSSAVLLSNHRHWFYHMITVTIITRNYWYSNLTTCLASVSVQTSFQLLMPWCHRYQVQVSQNIMQACNLQKEGWMNEWIWSSQRKAWKIQAWMGIRIQAWIFSVLSCGCLNSAKKDAMITFIHSFIHSNPHFKYIGVARIFQRGVTLCQSEGTRLFGDFQAKTSWHFRHL